MTDLRILPLTVSRVASPVPTKTAHPESAQRLTGFHGVSNQPSMGPRPGSVGVRQPATADRFPSGVAPLTVRNVQAHTAAMRDGVSAGFNAVGTRQPMREPDIDYPMSDSGRSAAPTEPEVDYWPDANARPQDPEVDYPQGDTATTGLKGILRSADAPAGPRTSQHVRFANLPEPEVDYPLDDTADAGRKGILRTEDSSAAPRMPQHVRFANASPLDVLLQFSHKGGSRSHFTLDQQRQIWDAASKVPYTAKATREALAAWATKPGLPPLAVLDAILRPKGGINS